MSENAVDSNDFNGLRSHANASSKARILVVDDTPANLALIRGLLSKKYKLSAVSSGEKFL